MVLIQGSTELPSYYSIGVGCHKFHITRFITHDAHIDICKCEESKKQSSHA